jgi:phosphoglycerol transferase MdoB-like AlkP superfamily enzyme
METRRGLVSVLCSHPDACLRSAMLEPAAQGRFLMLAGLLRQRGYKSVFVFGGRQEWENIGGFFVRDRGYNDFVGLEDMQDAAHAGTWGANDEDIFRHAHERFKAYGDQPFLGTILTITNHEPFNAPPVEGLAYVPGDTPEARRINCYRYADWAIGHFLDQARQEPYFKKTIFVIVADHGRDFSPDQFIDIPAYHIPFIIYAPGLVAPRRVQTVCSQTDIGPTVLSLLGGEYDHCFFGRNILDVDPADGFAFIHANGILGFVQGSQALIRPPGEAITLYDVTHTSQIPVAPPTAAASIPPLHDKMLSVYGWATKLYREGKYGPPPAK